NRYSSWTQLQRITALCQRFIKNLKLPERERVKGSLTSEELHKATIFLVSIVQAEEFADLRTAIQEGKPKHAFVPLSPFIEPQDNLVRVGGRIRNSSVAYDHKHPMLLPKHHRITTMIIEHYHLKLLHPGTNLLLATLRQTFWIPGGQSTVKAVTRK